jgi:molybdopterin molybdotransferase
MRASLDRDAQGQLHVTPFSDQDSSLLTVFSRADALLRRPADAPLAATGDAVEILELYRF